MREGEALKERDKPRHRRHDRWAMSILKPASGAQSAKELASRGRHEEKQLE